MNDQELIARVPLTSGGVAVIDAVDAQDVLQYRWSSDKRKRTTYVKGWVRIDGKLKKVYLHRFVLGIMDRKVDVDHKDNDGLNNRRRNLRACSHRKNLHRTRLKNQTGFRGVSYQGRKSASAERPYQATIRINGKKTNLGKFGTAEEASKAYNEAARLHYGEFAETKCDC